MSAALLKSPAPRLYRNESRAQSAGNGGAMPDTTLPTPDTNALPVHVPLVTEPLGLFGSLRAARRNVLEILPHLAVTQPIVSGKMGIRWHMVMDPQAIRHILLEAVEDYPKSDVTKNLLRPASANPCSLPRARTGAGSGALSHPSSRIAT
jgi:hypothetical protein